MSDTSTKIRIGIASLVLSAAGLVGIVAREGYTDQAVIPVPGDVPTLGFGTTEGVKLGDRTTPVKALGRALQDVNKFEGALKQCVKVPLSQEEYDLYVSFAYNIGPGAFCGSTLVKRLNQKDYAGACEEILRWNRVRGRVVQGLVNARRAEHDRCVRAQ